MNIIEKLIAIQAELKAPKGQYNTFGKYNYRSCEDILEALKPILRDNKCAITITDDLVNMGDRFHIKATVTLWDSESDNKIEVSGFAREEETKKGMDGSQITGASSSYSRKYALNGLFCIDDTKDSDGTNDHGKADKPPPSPKAPPEPPPPPPAPPVMCPKCGKKANGVTVKGKQITADEFVKGMGMCSACHLAEKAAANV